MYYCYYLQVRFLLKKIFESSKTENPVSDVVHIAVISVITLCHTCTGPEVRFVKAKALHKFDAHGSRRRVAGTDMNFD